MLQRSVLEWEWTKLMSGKLWFLCYVGGLAYSAVCKVYKSVCLSRATEEGGHQGNPRYIAQMPTVSGWHGSPPKGTWQCVTRLSITIWFTSVFQGGPQRPGGSNCFSLFPVDVKAEDLVSFITIPWQSKRVGSILASSHSGDPRKGFTSSHGLTSWATAGSPLS